MKSIKFKTCIISVSALLLIISCSLDNQPETIPLSGPYLGQIPPGQTPEIFAPGIISSGMHELDITITPDLNQIMFTRSGFDWTSAIIKLTNNDGKWSKPETFEYTKVMDCKYPFVSPDGNKLVFDSNRPLNGNPAGGPISNIWISERQNDVWSEPKHAGNLVNTASIETFPSMADNGNLYFAASYDENVRNFDIYISKFIEGKYTKPENLGADINSEFSEYHSYIAPDESYIIFDRQNSDNGYGRNDLFISFRENDGTWTKSKNMGDIINTEYSDMRPYVSPDGKYFFFCSDKPNQVVSENLWEYNNFMKRIDGPGNSSQDIYWMDAKIIEDIKPDHLK